MSPAPGSRIYDPTCGAGTLLIAMAEEVRDAQGNASRDLALYGQEINREAHTLSRMNMILHQLDTARIELGDSIRNPKLLEGDTLMKFDVVVAHPPFSPDNWGAEEAMFDSYGRFRAWDVPPKTKGDYAFILHMIASANDSGRVGAVVPHGVLFRGSSEAKIRQKLIEANLVEAVIGLPPNLFFNTAIPLAIVLFAKNRARRDVFFMDASCNFEPSKRQNKLRDEDIDHIVSTYRAFRFEEQTVFNQYCAVVAPEQIADNDFNLNIPRYVNTFEAQNEIDTSGLQSEINELERELAQVRAEMADYLIVLSLAAGRETKAQP